MITWQCVYLDHLVLFKETIVSHDLVSTAANQPVFFVSIIITTAASQTQRDLRDGCENRYLTCNQTLKTT